MATNVYGGRPTVVHAKVNISVVDTGINTSNTLKIYEVSDALRSYDPSRTLNQFSMFQAGRGYYFIAKLDMDLSEWLMPPFPTGSGGGIITESDVPIFPED